MTTTAPTKPIVNALASGHLPRQLPWLLLGASLFVMAGVFALIWMQDTEGDFNIVGTVLLGFIVYGIAIYVASRLVEGTRRAVDRLVTTLVTLAFVIALLPLISLLFTVVSRGLSRFDVEFFSSSMKGVVGDGGGAIHAIVGTLLITLAASIISIPIGLMTSIYLVEYGRGRIAAAITFFVDVMTGIPSIVAGLFAYALFTLIFGPGVRMGIMGSIALALLMIPVVVRSSEEMLRLVPNELREASYALGVPKWLTILKIVIPTSIAGITTGIMLAISRVIGETAPLLLTAGLIDSMNTNLFLGENDNPRNPMASLPVYVYRTFVRDLDADSVGRVWAGALTLILIVMLLNLVARIVARVFAPKAGR